MMAVVGRAGVCPRPVMRAPPPRLAARCTPRARPGAALMSRMGGWSGMRSARPAQRWLRAVLVQAASKRFVPFEEARKYAQELGLKNQKQWEEWRQEHRPPNIPSHPNRSYATDGWLSWADWLGYGKGHAPVGTFLGFEEAREYVRKVGLEGQNQWQKWCREGRRPADIPSNPDKTYADGGWLSWADWLGYGEGRAPKERPRRGFLEFEEARKDVREVGLASTEQWWEWCREGRRPADIPSKPNLTYADEGWLSWPDWLGYGEGQAPVGTFLPFEEARALVRELRLESQKQWQEWCRDGRRPADIPSRPDGTYADQGWLSWADWLGYGEGQPLRGTFLPFEEARALAREQGLESQKEWQEWCRDGLRPYSIPYSPDKTYASGGWLSWADWLGYGGDET